MKLGSLNPAIFRFGVFEFDPDRGELRKNGLHIRLSQQSSKLLHTLLKAEGQLCTREDLRRQLWPADTFVDFEHSLNKAVWGLRQALGDFVASPRYIETVAGQGYRFLVISLQPAAPPVRRPGNMRTLQSLAVVPPVNGTSLEECGFLAVQLACILTNRLSAEARLRVLSYSAVKQHNQMGKDPRAVGRELGVQGILAGEIVQRNGGVIINLELIDVTDGAHIWGMQLKEPWPQAADAAEQLADEIARQLQPILTARRKRNSPETATQARAAGTTLNVFKPPLLRTIRTKKAFLFM